MERCELSDLPVGQCACRVHKPGQEADAHPAPEPASRIYGPEIAARYPGRCLHCGDRVVVGEPVRMTLTPMGSRTVHTGCAS
jgi:hypothetical protein